MTVSKQAGGGGVIFAEWLIFEELKGYILMSAVLIINWYNASANQQYNVCESIALNMYSAFKSGKIWSKPHQRLIVLFTQLLSQTLFYLLSTRCRK